MAIKQIEAKSQEVEIARAYFTLLQSSLPSGLLIESDEPFFLEEIKVLLLQRLQLDGVAEVRVCSSIEELPSDFFRETDLFSSNVKKLLILEEGEKVKSKNDVTKVEALLHTVSNGSYFCVLGSSCALQLRSLFTNRGQRLSLLPMKPYQKKNWCLGWIRALLDKRGKQYDSKLPELFYSCCGFDRGLLLQEIDKLYLLAHDDSFIGLEIAHSSLVQISTATMWQLKEAIINGPESLILEIQEALCKMGVADLQSLKYLQTVFKAESGTDTLSLVELRALELKSGERDHPISQELFLLHLHRSVQK